MGSILIKHIQLDGQNRNVLIEGKRFTCLDVADGAVAETIIDGTGKALLPGLYNTHTHAPMTLLRGFGDDTPLEVWLHDYVWPKEAGFSNEDIRRGYGIATREMTRTGTVFCNEMYFGIQEAVDAIDESGLRACIGLTVLEGHPLSMTEDDFDFLKHWEDPTGGRIQWAVTPHALYTVSSEKLAWTARFARENGLILHTHLAETRTEVENCIRLHGMRPVAYLDSLGLLGPNTVAAHCVHVTEEEADLLAERQVTISHCPCSNMKLGSGILPYERLIKAGCRITLGTDGASSSNNLDLREAMKFAALLAKGDALRSGGIRHRRRRDRRRESGGLHPGGSDGREDATLLQSDLQFRVFRRFVLHRGRHLRRPYHLSTLIQSAPADLQPS